MSFVRWGSLSFILLLCGTYTAFVIYPKRSVSPPSAEEDQATKIEHAKAELAELKEAQRSFEQVVQERRRKFEEAKSALKLSPLKGDREVLTRTESEQELADRKDGRQAFDAEVEGFFGLASDEKRELVVEMMGIQRLHGLKDSSWAFFRSPHDGQRRNLTDAEVARRSEKLALEAAIQRFLAMPADEKRELALEWHTLTGSNLRGTQDRWWIYLAGTKRGRAAFECMLEEFVGMAVLEPDLPEEELDHAALLTESQEHQRQLDVRMAALEAGIVSWKEIETLQALETQTFVVAKNEWRLAQKALQEWKLQKFLRISSLNALLKEDN